LFTLGLRIFYLLALPRYFLLLPLDFGLSAPLFERRVVKVSILLFKLLVANMALSVNLESTM